MPKLSELTASRKTITVPFGDAALKVIYRPAVVTPRLQKAVAQAQRDQDIEAGMLVPISKLIASWDLTDDQDERIDLTPDALADVPAALLLGIMEAIGEDMAPNRTRGDDSSNGSSPRSSATAQTGTSS